MPPNRPVSAYTTRRKKYDRQERHTTGAEVERDREEEQRERDTAGSVSSSQAQAAYAEYYRKNYGKGSQS